MRSQLKPKLSRGAFFILLLVFLSMNLKSKYSIAVKGRIYQLKLLIDASASSCSLADPLPSSNINALTTYNIIYTPKT